MLPPTTIVPRRLLATAALIALVALLAIAPTPSHAQTGWPPADDVRSLLPAADQSAAEDGAFAMAAVDQGWNDQTDNSSVRGEHTLRGVDAVDGSYAWAVGGERDEDCVLLRTVDGGERWLRESCPRNRQLTNIHFHDRNLGWAAGRDGTMFKSVNGGDDWFRIGSGTGSTITGMHFIDDRHGWTVTRNSRVNITVDGGASWDQSSKVSDSGVMDVHFVDRRTGMLVGSDGLVMISSDSGYTWTEINAGTDRRLHSVLFSDPDNGWIAGNRIRYTNNLGGSWAMVHDPVKTIESLALERSGRVWAVGDEGLILHSPDNGGTWLRQARGMTGRGLRDVVALSDGTIWAVGTGGTILHRAGSGVAEPPDPIDPTDPPPPTRVPPTSTPLPTRTPMPSPTPTITPTPTPAEPWVSAQWSGGAAPLYVGRWGTRRVEAVFGNMPASGTISGTIEGPAIFASGEKSFSSTVFARAGQGRFTMLLRPEAEASPGQAFTLRLDLEGATTERQGMVAWQALIGWALGLK